MSIKNAERAKINASVEGVQYQNILPSYPVKSWNKFLSSSLNKTEIVKFLVAEWEKSPNLQKRSDKELYVIEGESRWKLDSTKSELADDLRSTQEEADTRMILHAVRATGNIVIHSDDTDVLVLLVSHNNVLNNIYIKSGRGTKSKIVQVDDVFDKIKTKIYSTIDIADFMNAMIGIHSFTGCDSISAFAGKGKNKALKLLMKNKHYVDVFKELVSDWTLTEHYENQIEKFVCNLYGKHGQH